MENFDTDIDNFAEIVNEVKENLDKLDEAIKSNPDNFKAYYDRAMFFYDYYSRIKPVDSAEKFENVVNVVLNDLDKAIDLNSNYVAAYFMRGFLFKQMGDEEKAYVNFTKAHSIEQKSPNVNIELALIHANREEYKEAITFCDYVLNEDANHRNAIVLRAQMHGSLGDVVAMNAGFTQALDMVGENAALYSSRAQVYQDMKLYAEALTDIDRAIELNEDIENFYHTKAEILKAMNEVIRAHDVLIDYYERNITDEVVEVLAIEYCNRGNTHLTSALPDRALEDYDRALSLIPTFQLPMYNKGEIFFNDERFDEALYEFERVLKLGSSQIGEEAFRSAEGMVRAIREIKGSSSTSLWSRIKSRS